MLTGRKEWSDSVDNLKNRPEKKKYFLDTQGFV